MGTTKQKFTAERISKTAEARFQPEAMELAEQIFFMRGKLEELRKELATAPVVTVYDNGGNQSGTHINPAFRAHRELLMSYTKALKALREILGNDTENENALLDAMRARIGIKKPQSAEQTEVRKTIDDYTKELEAMAEQMKPTRTAQPAKTEEADRENPQEDEEEEDPDEAPEAEPWNNGFSFIGL